MVRFVVGLFIFAVALCAYIINAQHGGVLPERQATTTQSVPVQPIAEDAREVTAPVTPAPAPTPVPPVASPANPIAESLAVSSLDFRTAPVPVATAVRDTLAVLGLDLPGNQFSTADKSFAVMIGESLIASTPDDQIIAAVNMSARAGDVIVPKSLVTADRQIDIATYLNAVIATAVLATEGKAPALPDLSDDPSAIISVTGYDYVITGSDSLAAIAVKFYGDVGQIDRLLTANPVILAMPDQLTAGATISIPAI